MAFGLSGQEKKLAGSMENGEILYYWRGGADPLEFDWNYATNELKSFYNRNMT